jgi:hypothetical protein
VGSAFWRPLVELVFDRLHAEGVVRPHEVGLTLLDDPVEIEAHLFAAWESGDADHSASPQNPPARR